MMARHSGIASPIIDWRMLALASLIVSTLLADAAWGVNGAKIYIQHWDTGIEISNEESGSPVFSYRAETEDRLKTGAENPQSESPTQYVRTYIRGLWIENTNWDSSPHLHQAIAEPLVNYMDDSSETPPEKSLLYSSTSQSFWASIARSLRLAYNFTGSSFTPSDLQIPETTHQTDPDSGYITRYEKLVYMDDNALILTFGLYDKQKSLPLAMIDVAYLRNTPDKETLFLIDISSPELSLSWKDKLAQIDRALESAFRSSLRYLSTTVEREESKVSLTQATPCDSAVWGALVGAGTGAVLGRGLELGMNFLSPLSTLQPSGIITIPTLVAMSALTAQQTLKQRDTASQCTAIDYVDIWLREAEEQSPNPIGLKGVYENAKDLFINGQRISAHAGLRYRKTAISSVQNISGFNVAPHPLPGLWKQKKS